MPGRGARGNEYFQQGGHRTGWTGAVVSLGDDEHIDSRRDGPAGVHLALGLCQACPLSLIPDAHHRDGNIGPDIRYSILVPAVIWAERQPFGNGSGRSSGGPGNMDLRGDPQTCPLLPQNIMAGRL